VWRLYVFLPKLNAIEILFATDLQNQKTKSIVKFIEVNEIA